MKDIMLKSNILVIGNQSIGKTSLIRRFVDNKFERSYVSTIGSDLLIKEISIPFQGFNFIVRLLLYDIGGQEQFHTRIGKYANICNAFLICYDITDISSFQSIEYWYRLLQQYLQERWDLVKNNILFIGTKADLAVQYPLHFSPEDKITIDYQREKQNQVSYNFIQQAKLFFNIRYHFETSALDNININDVFIQTAKISLFTQLQNNPLIHDYNISTDIFQYLA